MSEEIETYIDQFRIDREAALGRHISRLNDAIRHCRRNFRELTPCAFINRALRIWQETDNHFRFYMDLQNYLTLWIENNGITWTLAEMQDATMELCMFTLNWFREIYRQE